MPTDMYYLELGVPFGIEIPIYTRTLKLLAAEDPDHAIKEIMGGNFSGWSSWTMPSGPATNSGLDILMDSTVDKMLVFHIPSSLDTHFVKNAPLETVKAKGFRRVNVVRNTKTYPKASNSPIWASAEIKIGKSIASMKSNNPNATSDGHDIRKFPFFFNFVDSLTDISPATKIGHTVHHPHDHSTKLFFTHGGIHPPTFTNSIVLV